MCELFGMSSTRPQAGRALPLAEFRARGGGTADNPDGWGAAWGEGDEVLLEREPLPGCTSDRFDRLIDTLRSDLLVAHVRKARFPPVNTLNNTHPFVHDHLHVLESTGDMGETGLIATEPLGDNADWTPFEAGELRIYRAGARVGRISTSPPPVCTGMGPTRIET
jgi:predicted glutamine amidotransferase